MQVDLFKPIMHTALLMWKHSGYYNTAARMATLLREVCNDLIAQVWYLHWGSGTTLPVQTTWLFPTRPSRAAHALVHCALWPCINYDASTVRHCLLTAVTMNHRLQAHRFIPGPELLRMEPGEACDKLRLTLKVLGSFKAYYFSYRVASAVECPDNPWRFQNAAVFARLDRWAGCTAIWCERMDLPHISCVGQKEQHE